MFILAIPLSNWAVWDRCGGGGFEGHAGNGLSNPIFMLSEGCRTAQALVNPEN
jgi:hypothetical protein